MIQLAVVYDIFPIVCEAIGGVKGALCYFFLLLHLWVHLKLSSSKLRLPVSIGLSFCLFIGP